MFGLRNKHDDDVDITEERYRGPSVASAAAGEGFIAHFTWAGIGLLVGGLICAVFNKQIGGGLQNARSAAEGWRASSNRFTKAGGHIVAAVFGHGENEFAPLKETLKRVRKPGIERIRDHLLLDIESKEKGVGHWLVNHLTAFLPPEKRLQMFDKKDSPWETIAIGGGLLGAFGFFGSPWLLAGRGVQRGMDGKKQVKRLQQELAETRADYDVLRDRYVEVKLELQDIKASKDGTLKVAQDDPPKFNESSTTLPINASAPTADHAARVSGKGDQSWADIAERTPVEAEHARA